MSVASCLAWLLALLSIVAGLAALLKLKATPSGLLLALGLGGLGCVGIGARIIHALTDNPLSTVGVETSMFTLVATNVLAGVFWLVVAAGFAFLPMSLRRLADRAAESPTQF